MTCDRSTYMVLDDFSNALATIEWHETRATEEAEARRLLIEEAKGRRAAAEAALIALLDHNGVERVRSSGLVYSVVTTYRGRCIAIAPEVIIPSMWELKFPIDPEVAEDATLDADVRESVTA